MSFLPFYSPGLVPPKIIIAGGGYAGMAALISFHRHCPAADITLIDPREDHLKITHLHEVFRETSANLRVSFKVLAERFGFRYVQGSLQFDQDTLGFWQREKYLTINDEVLPFDYLLLAMGTEFANLRSSDRVLNLDDFTRHSAVELRRRLEQTGDDVPISVVGGGATGIQFCFEITHWLRARQRANPVRLIDAEATVLHQFTADLGKYAGSRLLGLGIEFMPDTLFQGQDGDDILVEHKQTGASRRLPSAMTYCFVGKRSTLTLETNVFGQVVLGHQILRNIFSAGDCSRYRSVGSNAMTAQSAVRKGKLSARNILRHSGTLKILEPYLHQDLGYIISMGPQDAIGWIGVQSNVVSGPPAVVVKDLVEAQHELLLAGVDTYLI